MYDDTRAAEQARALGLAPSWALPKLQWLLDHDPAAADDGARLAHQADVITRRLTGDAVPSDASHALKTGYDPEGACWPDALAPALAALLPDVVAPGTRLGVVCAAAAAQTGLPAGTPVIAGMTDGCAAQIAAGALEPGDWSSVLGTTLVLKGCSHERIDDRAARRLLAPLARRRLAARRRVEQRRGRPDGGLSGARPRRARPARRRPRAHGVLAYPLVSAGERFPFVAPDAEAFMLGAAGRRRRARRRAPAGPRARRAAVLRAARPARRAAARRAQPDRRRDAQPPLVPAARRRARSPVRLPAQSESAFGMAILAAAAAGGERVADVARRMSRTAEVLEPRPSMREHLDEQYARLAAELRRRGWLR